MPRTCRTLLVAAMALPIAGASIACNPTKPADAQPKPSTRPTSVAPATRPISDAGGPTLAAPKLSASKPLDYPGLHNVVAYAPDVLSGSVPEGEEGFASLAKLGIKTVLSVDGAEPELDKAAKYGLTYVHLPITYSGFDEKRKLELTKAVRDLPRPMYMHCHHGKHRSATRASTPAPPAP
jgi:protein tyrosine phosphatase (PTP) superfamily phosphohydrolase (DUF442 family)